LITPQPKTPQIVSFMRNLFGGFGILLLTGSALCFVAYFMNYWKNNDHSKQSLWLGVALIIVDVFSAFFSFYQEEKCKVIINSFKKIVPNKATVVRDNVIMVVKVENIVIGDIVQLRAGDKVPADIRI
jgi:sodium/potassium-transporting ATPase subunit alpha